MLEYSIYHVEELSSPLLNNLAGLCERAFGNDPRFKLLAKSNPTFIAPFFLALLSVAYQEGEVYVVVPHGWELPVSVAVWLPPGKALRSTNKQPSSMFDELVEKMGFGSAESVDVTEIKKNLTENFFPDNTASWSLILVATDLPYQGKGIASALIMHQVAKLKENKTFVSLCATNERIYRWLERLAFTVRGLGGSTGAYST
ncbi:unnamed protein product [Cyclocybe aegerita]|uniref:N-acetyltransferase domain-containing protein n=1 Tax=Cyclocybe aegerita TaxID=1973307 RepID=A0A8S0VTV0_CYCAE|nr:unnamed protein product [Cyclocybe aegerita]